MWLRSKGLGSYVYSSQKMMAVILLLDWCLVVHVCGAVLEQSRTSRWLALALGMLVIGYAGAPQ